MTAMGDEAVVGGEVDPGQGAVIVMVAAVESTRSVFKFDRIRGSIDAGWTHQPEQREQRRRRAQS